MIDTRVTVVGNVATAPQRVRLQHGPVTNFRLAATERRFDSTSQAWVDGATLWCDVECFDELGAHVSASLSKGDPVIVIGRLRTQVWVKEGLQQERTVLEALTIGHDLTRGTSAFNRSERPQVPEERDTELAEMIASVESQPNSGDDDAEEEARREVRAA